MGERQYLQFDVVVYKRLWVFSFITSRAALVIYLSRSVFCKMKIRVLPFLYLFFHKSFYVNILDKSLYLASKLDFLVNVGSLPF